MKESSNHQAKLIQNLIDDEMRMVYYNGFDCTKMVRMAALQAFSSLLKKEESSFLSYLLNGSRKGGFQNKLFQEHIRLVEAALPYAFIKNGKKHIVSSLLSKDLDLFSGVSKFQGIVLPSGEVQNKTNEFYIGGRDARYAQPYYIGKLLSVSDIKGKDLSSKVSSYGFSKIQLQGVSPGTIISVSHLRVPPHYGMGAMTWINRIKAKLSKLAKEQLETKG